MAESLGFSFAGRTIDYFGSKAITSDTTAMFELVKNARDANARKVVIHFENTGTADGTVTISDDGDGMSIEDIREKWMVIGTYSREHDDKTRTGKPVWGEMGIGRMACQKLGANTMLTSIKDGQMTTMKFDWSLFDRHDITVDKISFPAKTGTTSDANGTALKISGLKTEWTTEHVDDLEEELSVLISDDAFKDTEVVVTVDGSDEAVVGAESVQLRKNMTENAPFKLEAKFDGEYLSVKTLAQVGQRGEWVEQPVPYTFDNPDVGPFKLLLYHFPRAPGKNKNTTIENYYAMRMNGTAHLEAFLKSNHGVYLYRDGVWMKPYGGDNDWLSLEAGARQATDKIGIKQIYCQLHLSKKNNPGIHPASHRETLIENKAYADLKEITSGVFDVMRKFMKDWKKHDKKKEGKEMGATDSGNLPRTISDMLRNIRRSNVDAKTKRALVQSGNKVSEYVDKLEEEYKSKVSGLGAVMEHERNLATLGIATSFMAREVTGPLENNMRLVEEGEDMRKRISTEEWRLSEADQKRSQEMLDDMKNNQMRMLHFMKFVGTLTNHISQSIRWKKAARQVDVAKCWRTVTDGFLSRQNDLGIVATHHHRSPTGNTLGEKLVVKIDKIDLECVLTNLYLNSIESLEKASGAKRNVEFTYYYANGSLLMEFTDSGQGIPADMLETVFEPLVSTRSTQKNDMHGHGLGLHIVREIARHYGNGTAEAVDTKQGARIRVRFNNVDKVAN